MTDPNAINAMVRGALDGTGDRFPVLLGVLCDGDCGAGLKGDFVVHESDDQATRLGYVLDYAVKEGWTVCGRFRPGTASTYCPDCGDHVPPLTVPADTELVGTQFPGQMPSATWVELMEWYETNGFNPDLAGQTRDIVIGSTIDRWEVNRGGTFTETLTRDAGAVLLPGEEWSHQHEGHEGTARPVRLVSTPVKVPLPQHLRTAIEKAAAGKDLPGGFRTPVEWSAQHALKVVDPDGWRKDDGRTWHDPISEDEFRQRAAESTIREVPLTPEQESIQILHTLLAGVPASEVTDEPR